MIDYYGDLLVSRKARAEYRERKETGRRHKGLLREHGLDQTFDGDWHRGAGQLLLRWYSQSSHPSRLVLLDAGRIVLAAPPKRVTVGRDKKIQIVAEIPGDQAVIEDPLLGQVESDKLRVRFTDGSWLVLNVGERPNDIHRYLETVRDSGGGSGTRNLPVYVG
ncbi:hypothetical protein [Streptomyces sp. NPDC005322]|uniref:hypothetical protein n=1 Tax=Streptomyces sp. NPDC005322 TaxID=3157032 RepID=UPI0033B3F715